MRLILVAAAAAFALTACNPQQQPAPPAEPTPPVEPTPPKPELNGVDLTVPLRAVGTEPFWAMEISSTELKFSGADLPERTAAGGPPTMNEGEASWTGTTSDGVSLKATLTTGPCSDGMSDRTYPLTAKVEVGSERYNGCAATIEALERMRGQESGEVR